MPKIKLAIVSDAVYPFNKGGKEKRIYDITTRLAAQGYDVTIYCMKWWKGEKTIIQDGIALHAISPYYPLYTGNRRSIREAVLFSLSCFKLLDKQFDIIEVDHIPHLVLFTMKIVCLLKRKKMIVTWHEVWGREYWKQYLGVMGILAYWIERFSAQLPDLITSVSESTAKDLRNILDTKRPIVTVHNGLGMENLLNMMPAQKGADIIYAGRLLLHKNIDVLLRATAILAKQHPGISLFIIGDGPEKENLEALTKRLKIGKNVSFMGFFEDHDELYRIMHASRVFALPSTREGFGIALLEANACGMPVVTIDHEQNAARELIINGKNGILTGLDERQIAHAIKTLLNTGESRAMYPKYVEKYDWGNILPEIKKIYAL